ncbi:MAG: tetratricopeptide repeat protein [Burkholderiales bacterium]
MSIKLEKRLREALDRLGARDVAGAEHLCSQVLKKSPRHAGALHLLGLVRLAAGDAREAIALIERVVAREPHNPAALENLGVAYLTAGEAETAERHLRRALRLGAAHATLRMRLGLALMSQRRLAEAIAEMRAAAEQAPDDATVFLNLGNALAEDGRADEALASYRRILAAHPEHVDARFNMATQLRRMGRLAEAEAEYRSVLAADPSHADAHHNLGLVHQQQGLLDAAAACYRGALALDPRHARSLNNLGNILREQERHDESVSSYEKALASDPAYLDAYVNLGIAWAEQGRYAEAVAQHERALLRDPRFASARYNLALARLYLHDFGQGWPAYEWRLQCAEVRAGLRRDAATTGLFERLPRWGGPDEAEVGEVAIWAEQGIGDQVLFSTLLPELIGARVPFVYEVDRRLLGAYERAFPGQRFVSCHEPPHDALLRADRALLAGSLPALFRSSRDGFARQPARLLDAQANRVAYYRQRLAATGAALAVALSWRSSRKDYLGPRKSAALSQFGELLELPGIQFLDVQYGDTVAERRALAEARATPLLRFDEVDYFNDLEEVLAILQACDLVITTSNATAHLAGALGKRTWLLYLADHPPFHYWAHDASYRCLWYPSVEIVTARDLADWPALARHVADRLRQLTGGH